MAKGRKGARPGTPGSGRARETERACASERLWWGEARVVLAERTPGGALQVLVRGPSYSVWVRAGLRDGRWEMGRQEARADERWLEPGLRDPLSARVRSALARRALLDELRPVLDPLRRDAAREVSALLSREKATGKRTD